MTPSSINIDPDTGQIVMGKVLFQGPVSSPNHNTDTVQQGAGMPKGQMYVRGDRVANRPLKVFASSIGTGRSLFQERFERRQ